MTGQLVLVTGATGFIGSHVVQQLQVAGYRVRAVIKCFEDEDVASLEELVPDAKHKLELVEADLNFDKGWDEAVAGCWAVAHLASLLPSITVTIPEEEFMETTVQGALRVLRAASVAGVKKMVMTGSFASIISVPMPFEDKLYTEDHWTDVKFPNLESYGKSKTVAELAAWDFVKKLPGPDNIELTVLLPTTALGPPLLPSQKSSVSITFINMIMNRDYPGYPHIQEIICDVRDVARAHVMSLTTPAAAGQRILINSASIWVADVAKIIASEFSPQGYFIYSNTLPYFVFWILSFFNTKIQDYDILGRIGIQKTVSNQKMVEVLGITPRNPKQTILEMVYTMIELGMSYKTVKYRQVGSRAEEHFST